MDPSSQTSDGLSGIVELCVDGAWTAVCSEGWSTLETSVVCMQLGHSQYGTKESRMIQTCQLLAEADAWLPLGRLPTIMASGD